MSEKPTSSQLRRAGLIFRITAAVFAVTGITYAVNAYRHEVPDSDMSMSVLQFSLAVVFFAVGASCYQRARAEQPVRHDDGRPE
ncbi:MAG TPA: hypothetical protein VGO11_13085 [Chthoniobacteraceae bacterium]|jgi:hypothetical protein|nr:hypothetical protein [Chthoniobacteraceae bacterium]